MTGNFTGATPTIDAALAADAAYGSMRRFFFARNSTAATAATTGSGSVTGYRYDRTFSPPSLGSGVSGYMFPTMHCNNEDADRIMIGGIETVLGTLTVSGNSFSSGSAMPTMTIKGASVTTAASLCFATISAAVTATTPTLTITYTDQDGNTGNSCAPVLPTSPALNTCFYLQPHLASGDTGIRAVTNMSISTGSAGTIIITGLLPLVFATTMNNQLWCNNMLQTTFADFMATNSHALRWYRFTATATSDISAIISGLPEPT